MDNPRSTTITKEESQEVDTERSIAKYREIISTLPKEKGWATENLIQYNGYWFDSSLFVERIMLLQNHFRARPDDVLLITSPKSGTTWLKAIVFCILNRTRYDFTEHPLLANNPHISVPFLEMDIYGVIPTANAEAPRLLANAEAIPSPRLLATHVPYELLPESVMSSGCKIIYLCRDPKDVFVSLWHFQTKVTMEGIEAISLERAFDSFVRGVSAFGPIWDHVLGYWRASCECPDRFLFLKYEELQANTADAVERMARFLGCPFSPQEEETGVVKQIVDLCTFDSLRDLDVNKTGRIFRAVETDAFNKTRKTFQSVGADVFFRKGKVGDWKNFLTPIMVERLDRITEEKITKKSSLRF